MITTLVALAVVQSAFGATKTRSAVSPYIQTDVNSTYSFVGITHPSLNTAATQIGLTVATVGLTGTEPSTTFTINAGETYRIFIVSTNHSSINSVAVTGSRVIFLSTTTGQPTTGQLLFTANTADPLAVSRLDVRGLPTVLAGLEQLSLWGAIVVPSTQTGFAMEFIGDAHDSAALLTTGAMGGSQLLDEGRGIK